MANPWLDVPLADYEGHMEHVGQARMLGEVFGQALRMLRPQSVAVLGAAGGNGFEHLVSGTVARVVALDLNRDYLQQLDRRYRDRVPNLEIVCGDLADPAVDFAPVDLVHAALVFEYVDVERILTRTRSWLQPDGTLSVVLQLPDESLARVTPSPFGSLSGVGRAMRLQDADSFRESATMTGFAETSHEVLVLPGGKRFFCARSARKV